MSNRNYLVLLKIGYPINDSSKRAFWIDGNIHAREWASSHTALYFINQVEASLKVQRSQQYCGDRLVKSTTDFILNDGIK